jgi:hypothetical protein
MTCKPLYKTKHRKADYNCFDYGVQKSESLGCWTLFIRLEFQVTLKHNVSETGSAFLFRLLEVDTYSVGSLRKN